jgi:hypothetical protein
MTDRKDALITLLAKVKAGDTKTGRFSMLMRSVFPYHDKIGNAAYNGSLDAAKALHEATLPDYHLNLALDFCHVLPDWNDGDQRASSGYCDGNPARAWLIAILKALIAQDTTQDGKGTG